jgi:hypothetical protein
MGKWVQKAIEPMVGLQSHGHIEVEDLARLVDGEVDPSEKQRQIHHLNRCPRCYEIFQATLKDTETDFSVRPTYSSWWKSKITYAIAASIMLVFLIGGQLVLKYGDPRSQVILATLEMDQELKDILLETDEVRWQKADRINRLVKSFRQKGLQVMELDLVVLAKPYFQKKSLFGPQEILHIRIEKNVAYLEVKESN